MHDQTRRSRPRRIAMLVTVLMALALVVPTLANAGTSFSISISRVARGFSFPTEVTNAGDGTNRLFIVEKRGTVRVINGSGNLVPGYFMDIRSRVSASGERGLLGLAFHPDFETNRTLFAFYTRNDGDVVVARFRTNNSRTNVSESTHAPLLLIEHSARSNHNGGGLKFGPDGYLYVSVGDGGGSGDPGNDAQEKTSTFLGKVLRIDVDGTGDGRFDRYDIPSSNPYAGPTPGFGEIWAIGLRNPWRISFDRDTGAFYIADVGQGRREEVNREPAGFAGGRNYGWRVMEGSLCYGASTCSKSGKTLPVTEYSHSGGNCSITGGYVYRGSAYPVLVGSYVFADYCSGKIWTVPASGGAETLRYDSQQRPTSFGESENGELYMVTSTGSLFRVRAS
jgi:glucose/arabinose dehydrogenase